MTLFITSSPFCNGVDRPLLNPENDFLDRLKAVLPPFPRCLFVCSTPDRRDLTCRFGADMHIACAEAGLPFSTYAVLDAYNAEDAGNLIHNSDLIVLAGGHVPTQNAFFMESGLPELLQDFHGVIIGISAGSMNLAKTVYVQPEEPGEALDPNFLRFAPGLGLTEVNVCPHYQKVRHATLDGMRLFEHITYEDSYGHCFFAIPDGSYIYQDDENLLLCGEGYRIKDGILELLTRNGETLDLTKL